MDLIGLLEAVLILGVIVYILYAVANVVPISEPFRTIAIGIIAIICILIAFNLIRGLDAGGILRLR